MTAAESLWLAFAVFLLGCGFGGLLVLVFGKPRAEVIIRREPAHGIQRGEVWERYELTSEQQAQLFDRVDALERELATTRGLLTERRLDEVTERRAGLRVVEG